MRIHPTAVVHDAARLGSDVEVGAHAVIGAGVEVGAGCRIGPHAVLEGPMTLGEKCLLGAGAALGGPPQIKGKDGPWGGLRIGARNVFREYTTVHRAMHANADTVIGDDNFFMATAHVAHDCVLGDHIVMANGSLLAGHVEVGDRVFISGLAAAHQFVRLGEYAMLAGGAILLRDGPPYTMIAGARPSRLAGLNAVGLRRAGFSSEVRLSLKRAYQVLFRSELTLAERLVRVECDTEQARKLVDFVRNSKRGVAGIRPRRQDGSCDEPTD